MTFLVDLVVGTIARTVVWVAIAAAGAAAATAAVVGVARPVGWRIPWFPTGWAALAGAAVGLSLPERFTWPTGVDPAVWRWHVPVLWMLGGAMVGAAAAAVLGRVRSRAGREGDREALPAP